MKVKQALGQVSYQVAEQEKKSLQFRRSLYFVEDIKAGEVITEKNMRAIRPGLGVSPKFYNFFIGKIASKDIKKGTPVNYGVI